MINNSRGSILVFALWTLALLGVFAVQIGMTIGGRVSLLSRIENHSRLRYLTQSAVKKTIAVLRTSLEQSTELNSYNKYYRYNNPALFNDAPLNNGIYRVSYTYCDSNCRVPMEFYGMVEEESKLNMNTASREEIVRLIQKVTAADSDGINNVADGILGWRAHGDKDISGFYSDDYYAGLPQPYEAKHAEFEIFEELLLIKGMTSEIYRSLLPFITIYGDGKVNINTAPEAVLYALGLEDETAGKILSARRGIDGRDNTEDDHVFIKTFDVATEMKSLVALDPEQIRQIDKLNADKKIKSSAEFYRFNVTAKLTDRSGELFVRCVYNLRDNLIESYRENNTILY